MLSERLVSCAVLSEAEVSHMIAGKKVEPAEVLHRAETLFVVNDTPSLKLRRTKFGKAETRFLQVVDRELKNVNL